MKTVTLYHLLLSLLLFAAFQPSPLHLPSTVALGAKITNKELRSVHHWSSNSMHINGELVSKAIEKRVYKKPSVPNPKGNHLPPSTK
uniref:Uncharacterized protein n=1 Tax=Cucumis sativus TaxID=3659 RepID=A0A0A0LUT6_CUCSA